MQKSTKLTNLIKCIGVIIFLLIFVLLYAKMEDVFSRKDSYSKNGAFMEEEKDFDVIFFGTSHMIDGMFPMELWNQYGIFSYNLAGPNNSIAASYWELVNVLDHKKPQLVVIDCSTLSTQEKVIEGKEGQLHRTMDIFPLSPNKIRAAYDLVNEKERVGFLWEFALYHSRWNQLSEEDFKPEFDTHKGANTLINVEIPDEMETVSPDEKSPADAVGAVYMRKMIELCKEEDIDILLTYIPFPAKKSRLKEANLAREIADEYQVNFLNFLEMDGIVDFDTDCYDAHSHLNPSGARKVTEYMGAYIQETYGIKDRREDPQYASWHEDYEAYTVHKIDLIEEQQELDNALMLHYDKNISTCIFVKEGSAILQDERMQNLIKNVSPYEELTQLEAAATAGSAYFVLIDNGWCKVWESVGGEALSEVNTTFGNLSYSSDEGNPALFIQGTEENYLQGGEDAPDVQIVTINRLTGQIVYKAAYEMAEYDEHGNAVATKVQ